MKEGAKKVPAPAKGALAHRTAAAADLPGSSPSLIGRAQAYPVRLPSLIGRAQAYPPHWHPIGDTEHGVPDIEHGVPTGTRSALLRSVATFPIPDDRCLAPSPRRAARTRPRVLAATTRYSTL